jgi:hypothetical protein
MSVTLWMPQAPVVRVEPYPEEEPGYFTTEPMEPFVEINMSNTNFRDFMRTLLPGRDMGDGGVLSFDDCAKLYRNAFAALNRDSLAESLMEPEVRDGNMIYCGRDKEYVDRRLQQIIHLCMVARAHRFEVVYG